MKIFKIKLGILDLQWILMPEDAKVLSCQIQDGDICLWVAVEPLKKSVKRLFEIVGTGHEMTLENKRYISTVQMGSLVWHVFEVFTN